MSNLLLEAGKSIISQIIQFTIGFILALFIYSLPNQKLDSGNKHHYLTIIVTSLLGMLLPIGIYGLIPICVAFTKIGFPLYATLPLIISNAIFNALVPFFDPTFTWRTGLPRIIIAFLAGIIAGVSIKAFRFVDNGVLEKNSLSSLFYKPEGFAQSVKSFFKSLRVIGIYLLIGVCAELLLKRFDIVQIIFQMAYAPQLGFIAKYFLMISTKSLFLLAMVTLTALINPIRLSGVFTLLGIKGIYLYTGCLSCLIMILVTLSMVQ
jgi:uncharacterized membrane protein YraQ (UPF0718 family)